VVDRSGVRSCELYAQAADASGAIGYETAKLEQPQTVTTIAPDVASPSSAVPRVAIITLTSILVAFLILGIWLVLPTPQHPRSSPICVVAKPQVTPQLGSTLRSQPVFTNAVDPLGRNRLFENLPVLLARWGATYR
jgi:hypothetical protein